jgi:dipeptidyl aminopeptidase/acylaminoacyl peptidase
MSQWVGKDTWGGVAPSESRKDLPPPPHWRLEAVAATERCHHLVVGPDRETIVFILDRADLGSDVWILDPGSAHPRRLTVDRPPAAFWEDTAPSFSSDGTAIAYTASGYVCIVPADGGPSRRLTEAGSPHWLPNDHIVVTVDQKRIRSGDHHPRSTEVTRLAVVDPSDPWAAPITPPTADATTPVGSPDGSKLAFTSFPPDDRNRSDIRVLDLVEGSVVTVAGSAGMHADGSAWAPDGAMLAFVSEEPGWYEIHLAGPDGNNVRQLTDDGADFGALEWSFDGTRILATRARRGRTDVVAVSVADGSVELLAEGGDWQSPRWLADQSVVAVFEDHATPARIERITGGRRSVVYDPSPTAIRSAPHVSPQEITFRSSDGLEIHGFLFRPIAATPDTPVAAVVYPHGGPTSAYTDSWDGHAQYFIDKGYAWLAINFRGSTTYGRAFERSNHGVWGVADTEDCLAAADFLASLEWIDERRIAIFGASYGSYMALASLAFDPGHRFACGVAKYGDCDILTSWAQGDREGSEDLERQMGHPADHPADYRAGSPVHHVTDIARPILIAHGELDTRVHPKQSEELVRRLERLDKAYEYVTYPTEGHGLLRIEPQLHFYRRLERFLDWYLM